MRRDDALFRVLAGERVHVEGFLEDYGSLGNACLSLYEATLDPRWLSEAAWIADAMVARFRSPSNGLFHDAAEGADALVVRPRDIMDNATPSGNSLAAELLARSAVLTGDEKHGEIADAVVARERGALERYPAGVGRLLTVALLRETARVEVTVVDSPEDARAALRHVHQYPYPNRVIAGGDPRHPLVAALPAMEGRLAGTGKAFVCAGAACYEPSASLDSLDRALQRAHSVIF